MACVRDSLDAFLYDNAKFMCERLYAEYPTEVRLQPLLADLPHEVWCKLDEVSIRSGAHKNDSPVSIQENLLLLANTYMQSNQAYRAFNLLSGTPCSSVHQKHNQGEELIHCVQLYELLPDGRVAFSQPIRTQWAWQIPAGAVLSQTGKV